jgi:UMP-CMP kinase
MQGRDDDNIDTIRRRFDVFQQQTLPVIQYYEKRGKLRKVDGNRQVDEVFEDVKAIFAQLNNQVTPIFLSV